MLQAELILTTTTGLAVATLNARVYFEHVHREPLFLPLHESFAELVGPPDVEQRQGLTYPANDVVSHPLLIRPVTAVPIGGLIPRTDGLELVGPGTVSIRAAWTFPRGDLDEISSWGSPTIRLAFGIAGSEDVAGGEFWLDHRRAEPEAPDKPRFTWRLADADDPRIIARRIAYRK